MADTNKGCTIITIIFCIGFCFLAQIVPALALSYYHFEGRANTDILDIAVPIVTVVLGTIPMFLFLFIFLRVKGDQGDSGFAKTVRYALSKLIFPGFWSASVRNDGARKKEKRGDCFALFVFFAWFIGFTLVFYTLMGVIGMNSEKNFVKHDQVRLYNGVISYKPNHGHIDSLSFVLPGGGEMLVAKNATLIPGPVIEQHEDNVVLSPSKPNLTFAYTFAPGSIVSLNVNSQSSFRLTLKKNDTIVKNAEVMNKFDLSFTETEFTSYMINISSPESSGTSVSYDFVAKTKTFNMDGSRHVYGYGYVELKDDEMILFSRSYKCSDDEFISITIEKGRKFSSRMPLCLWWWLNDIFVMCPVLLCLELFLVSILVATRSFSSTDFTESPDETGRGSKSRLYGHFNFIILLIFVVIFFVQGYFQSSDDIDNAAYLFSHSDLYPGQQIVLNMSDRLGETWVSFDMSSDVRLSAVSKLPDHPSDVTTDLTPGPFKMNSYWSAPYYLDEGSALEWDVEFSGNVTLSVLDDHHYSQVLYIEDGVNKSKHTFTYNETSVFVLRIEAKRDTDVTFHSLKLSSSMYDVTANTVWYYDGCFNLTKLSDDVNFLVLEPSRPNITVCEFMGKELLFWGKALQALMTNKASLVLMIVLMVFVLLAVVFMIIDCTGAVNFGICYIFYKSDSGYTRINSEIDDPLGD